MLPLISAKNSFVAENSKNNKAGTLVNIPKQNSVCAVFSDKLDFGPGTWGPNIVEFKRRFDPETTNGEGPQWLKNLYFTYLVELRALVKAAPYLKEVRFLFYRLWSPIGDRT